MKQFFMSSVLAITLVFTSCTSYSFMPGAGNRGPGGMPELTPQQMKELEELEKQLSQMSPQEQEQFFEQAILTGMNDDEKKIYYETKEELKKKSPEELQEIADMLSRDDLSEDDLTKYLDDLFPDQNDKPEAETPEEKPKPEEKAPVMTSKQAQAADLIDKITKVTELFLVKTEEIPDMSIRVEDWAKDGSLRGWPTAQPWETAKANVQSMMSKLKKIRSREIRTKKYKYLDDFIANEGLKNNVTQVYTVLYAKEKQIVPPTFGLEELDDMSKKGMYAILNMFTEALTLLDIPKELDAIFEKYEPKAQKAREKEEQERQKAIASGKIPRYAQPAITGGRGEGEGRPGYPGGYGGGDYGYPGDGYGGDYGNYPYSGSDYGSPSFDDLDRSKGKGGKDSGTRERPVGEKEDGASGNTKKTKETNTGISIEKKAEINQYIKVARDALVAANKELQTHAQLKNIDTYLPDSAQAVDMNLFKAGLPTITEQLTKAGQALQKADAALAPFAVAFRKQYAQNVNSVLNKEFKEFEDLLPKIMLAEQKTKTVNTATPHDNLKLKLYAYAVDEQAAGITATDKNNAQFQQQFDDIAADKKVTLSDISNLISKVVEISITFGKEHKEVVLGLSQTEQLLKQVHVILKVTPYTNLYADITQAPAAGQPGEQAMIKAAQQVHGATLLLTQLTNGLRQLETKVKTLPQKDNREYIKQMNAHVAKYKITLEAVRDQIDQITTARSATGGPAFNPNVIKDYVFFGMGNAPTGQLGTDLGQIKNRKTARDFKTAIDQFLINANNFGK